MRSKFEGSIAKQLEQANKAFLYERYSFDYEKKVRSAQCSRCDSTAVYQKHRYTPDFYLVDYDYYIETKGVFSPSDRAKMLLMKEQHPKVEIRLLFQRDNRIPIRGPKKKKPTSYTEWAKLHGFKYAVGEVPKSWLV